MTAGARGAYDVLIDGYQVTLGGLKGQYLNAWTHSNLAIPEYEDTACERPEDGLKTACERPEDGHIQDVLRSFVDVSKCDLDEARAQAVALSHPHSGDEPERTQDNDNDNINNSGKLPRTPDINSVCPVDENELTECIYLWREILDSSPDEDDFRELLSDGKFIRSLEQNEITLSILFTWSQLTSDRFQGMKSSRDFRLEANTVLTRFINYVKTSSPRKVRQRVEEDLERVRVRKYAEFRQPQIQEAWQTIMGTELDPNVSSRWSYLFDYGIGHFLEAFKYLEASEPRNLSEVDKEIKQIIEAACGVQEDVEDDDVEAF